MLITQDIYPSVLDDLSLDAVRNPRPAVPAGGRGPGIRPGTRR
ncbi:hypothetical protein [Streptomyces phyllanthi]|nr:hypothetical protein [Streptomyces phyllanthi]